MNLDDTSDSICPSANIQQHYSRMRQRIRVGLQLSETLQSQLDEVCKTLVAAAMSELEINSLKDLNALAYRDFHQLVREKLQQSQNDMQDRLLEQEEEKDILHENPSIEELYPRVTTTFAELYGLSPIPYHSSPSQQEQERMSGRFFETQRKEKVESEHSPPEPLNHNFEGSNSPHQLRENTVGSLSISSTFTFSSLATNNETGAISFDLTNQESSADAK